MEALHSESCTDLYTRPHPEYGTSSRQGPAPIVLGAIKLLHHELVDSRLPARLTTAVTVACHLQHFGDLDNKQLGVYTWKTYLSAFRLSIHPSIHRSIHPDTYLSIDLSIYLPVCLSVCLSGSVWVWLGLSGSAWVCCGSVRLSVCPSVRLSVCLSVIHLSIYLCT